MADNTERERREGLKTLENKIQNLTDTVNKAIERWDESAKQVTRNQVDIARLAASIDGIDDDVKNLEAKSNVWDGINTILLFIAGALGLSK